MDILQDTIETPNHTFFNHVFSSTEEGKAEFLNISQYSLMAVVPVVILNKSIQRFIPEADTEKSSLELLVEIFIQLIVMFCGIIIIHRIITYFPTYSGYKYEHLTLTNAVLGFLVIVLSIQSKLGLKVNILVDRVTELWEGSSVGPKHYDPSKKSVKFSVPIQHSPSQADYLDDTGIQPGLFPPAPTNTTGQTKQTYNTMMRGGAGMTDSFSGPMAANSILGGAFGSSF
jgi:hypothetical protein